MKYIYIYIVIVFFLISCEKPKYSIVDDFKVEKQIYQDKSFQSENDYLANPYLILCLDSLLIVNDPFELQHFTLFDSSTGKFICRFGDIGVGPGELLLGNILEINDDRLISYDIPRKFLYEYDLDSLTSSRYRPELKAKVDVQDAIFTRVLIANDSNLLGAGLYKSQYQYVYMTRSNQVIDYNVDVFNSKESIGMQEKYLSNQGILKKHPIESKFVFAVSKSSNIDFFEIVNDKIKIIKTLHLANPEFTIDDLGGEVHSITYKETETIQGYLDIFCDDQFVYTLYTDKKIKNNRGEYNPATSDQILVFDWTGKPIMKYVLDEEVYYFSVNKDKNVLYAIGKENDGGSKILKYKIK